MPVTKPKITSNGGLATASITLDEGVTAVTTVVGTDADGDPVNYKIVGGVDASKFRINATTGELIFIAPPDFEAPKDTTKNGSNTYEVIVQVADGPLSSGTTLKTTQTITVTIDDVTAVTLNGGSGNSTLGATATVEGDTLNGNDGDDSLNGGLGADFMFGGADNDTYFVDNVGDIASEDDGTGGDAGGDDTVNSSVTYTIGDFIENLVLTGTANINGTGNDLDNTITGNAKINRIDGGAGADDMAGLAGSDVYIVDDAGDTVTEAASAGTDKIISSVDISALATNVENLTLTGVAVTGTGNASANTILGNDENNNLSGLDGNDKLDGGAGDDTMTGGLGNDTFYVDSTDDVVVEALNQGTDLVYATATFTLSDNVENLTLKGDAAINGTGNALANKLTGNALANTLVGLDGNDVIDGKAGIDTMEGGDGNDKYYANKTEDVVTELDGEGTDEVIAAANYVLSDFVENLTLSGTAISGEGNDLDNIIKGTSAANTLIGNAGDDRLDGGTGNDSMAGGEGSDTYVVNSLGDLVTEVLGEGDEDTVEATLAAGSTYTLGEALNNLVLKGFAAFNGTGNELDNDITGNGAINTLLGGDGNDRLNGASGNDIMDGEEGSDTYVVQQTGDTTVDSGTGVSDVDTVESSITITIDDSIENLTLTGSSAINGTGNASDNVITGNTGTNQLFGLDGDDTISGGSGNDRITGGAGADQMTGGIGNETYVYETLADSGTDAGVDTDMILDFNAADKIDLSLIDARENMADDQAFVLDANGTFVEGEIGMSRTGNVVTISLYTDADVEADMVIQVTVDGSIPSGNLVLDDYVL